jgi:hypothetical protein
VENRKWVNIDVVKAVLAHTALDDVTLDHYAQSALAKETREALTKWQAAVTQMVRGEAPFAFRAEDAAEMERQILGQDRVVSPDPTALNVMPLRVVCEDLRGSVAGQADGSRRRV